MAQSGAFATKREVDVLKTEIKRLSEKPFGDRRQELVFIGQQLDEGKMRVALDT